MVKVLLSITSEVTELVPSVVPSEIALNGVRDIFHAEDPSVKALLLFLGIAAVLAVAWFMHSRGRVAASTAYVRNERKEVAAFYAPHADFMAETPKDLVSFIEAIAESGGLPRFGEAYPTDIDTLARAAANFCKAAQSVYGFTISVEADDPHQLDRFANAHLIDPVLREFFDGARLREQLPDEEAERVGEAIDAARIPNEPLLYYSMGAYWGEWLVRHRNGAWRLYEPLRPIQSFPDMITTGSTVCLHPFSQVTKKLADPAGDDLAYKATVSSSMKRYFPPFPLVASMADAEHAAAAALPPGFSEGLAQAQAGNHREAVRIFDQYLQPTTGDPQLFYLAIPSAWEEQDWKRVERWSVQALQLAPRHPVLNHNLAVLYSNFPGAMDDAIKMLKVAVDEDPTYARARLTLASCLVDSGKKAEALEHLNWIIEFNQELGDQAEDLKRRIRDDA